MNFNPHTISISNQMREAIQKNTSTAGDGEAIAMMVLWGFLVDQAEAQGMDPKVWAREQLDTFIQKVVPKFKMSRVALPPRGQH